MNEAHIWGENNTVFQRMPEEILLYKLPKVNPPEEAIVEEEHAICTVGNNENLDTHNVSNRSIC